MLGFFVFTATPAAATCGDYVHVGGPAASQPADQNHHPAPTPCHGPNCSERKPAPPAAPTAPPTAPSHEKEWASGLEPLVPPHASLGWVVLPPPPGVTGAPSDPIFHPPRV